jgi:hypothetical protein
MAQNTITKLNLIAWWPTGKPLHYKKSFTLWPSPSSSLETITINFKMAWLHGGSLENHKLQIHGWLTGNPYMITKSTFLVSWHISWPGSNAGGLGSKDRLENTGYRINVSS